MTKQTIQYQTNLFRVEFPLQFYPFPVYFYYSNAFWRLLRVDLTALRYFNNTCIQFHQNTLGQGVEEFKN